MAVVGGASTAVYSHVGMNSQEQTETLPALPHPMILQFKSSLEITLPTLCLLSIGHIPNAHPL